MKQKNRVIPAFRFFIMFLCVSCGGGGGRSDSTAITPPLTGQLSGGCFPGGSKILAGTQCSSGVGPVVTLLILAEPNVIFGSCTGTFLDLTHILTAAHCNPQLYGANKLLAVIGEDLKIPTSVIASSSVVANPSWVPAEELDVHAYYRNVSRDIAVVTLANPAPAAALPLFFLKPPEVGEVLSIFGYGVDESGLSAPARGGPLTAPQKTDLSVLRAFEEAILFSSNTGGVCPGDSGGPALRLDEKGNPGIVAVASNALKLEPCQPARPLSLAEVQSIPGITAGEIQQLQAVFSDGKFYFTAFANLQTEEARDFILSQAPLTGML